MTKIWCHRGYSGLYPENTMLAFQKAMETGADGIELDVQLSKDGEVVVIHDETVDRTTDGSGFVADMTLSELKKLNASVRRPEFGFQDIPTFREYLALAAEKDFFTNVELKTWENPYPGIEEKVWKLIQEFGLEKRVIFSSFRYESLLRMRKTAPEVPCGYLCDDWTGDLSEYILSLGLQACHPHYLDLSRARCRRLSEAGLPVHTYTPNRQGALARLMDWNVAAVITNEPELALRVRGDRS